CDTHHEGISTGPAGETRRLCIQKGKSGKWHISEVWLICPLRNQFKRQRSNNRRTAMTIVRRKNLLYNKYIAASRRLEHPSDNRIDIIRGFWFRRRKI